MIDWERFITRAAELVALGVLGAFGGIANYVYNSVKRHKTFSFWLFLANMVLAAFVGVVVGQFISLDNNYRDGYIMAFGFSAYPVLELLEDRVKAYLDRRFPDDSEG